MLVKVVKNIWLLFLVLLGIDVLQMWEKHNTELTALNEQIPVLESKIQRSKKHKKKIKQYLEDIQEAKKQINLVAEEVEKISRQLPDTIDDTENLVLIKKTADGLNIKNVFLSPLNEENRGFFVAKRYELTGVGTFLQFLVLMEKIGADDRLLNVKNVEFTRSKERQRGRFQIIDAKVIVEAYRYNSDYKESRGIDEIEKQFQEDQKKKKRKKRKKKSRKKKA